MPDVPSVVPVARMTDEDVAPFSPPRQNRSISKVSGNINGLQDQLDRLRNDFQSELGNLRRELENTSRELPQLIRQSSAALQEQLDNAIQLQSDALYFGIIEFAGDIRHTVNRIHKRKGEADDFPLPRLNRDGADLSLEFAVPLSNAVVIESSDSKPGVAPHLVRDGSKLRLELGTPPAAFSGSLSYLVIKFQ